MKCEQKIKLSNDDMTLRLFYKLKTSDRKNTKHKCERLNLADKVSDHFFYYENSFTITHGHLFVFHDISVSRQSFS